MPETCSLLMDRGAVKDKMCIRDRTIAKAIGKLKTVVYIFNSVDMSGLF